MATSIPSTASSIFNLGNGLIEISALTSMIGSSTARNLALGNKGAAGFVWATMSSFGTMSVVRSCLAVVIPTFLLDTLGARSAEVDAVIGYTLDLNKEARHRNRIPVAKGIEVELRGDDSDQEKHEHAHRDVHVFDQRTSNILRSVSFSEPKEGIKVYTYVDDPYKKERMLSNARVDAIGLFLYVVKLAEVVTLGIRGAHALAWISFLNWLFFSLAGIVLFTYGIFQARTNNTRSAYTDVLAGLLPTPSTKGGGHVIVLGIPRDIRHSTLWKVIHALSCIISAASVTACYVVLGRDSDLSPFLIWTGFQITWLVLRSTFFFLVNDRETYRNDIMAQKDWKLLSTQERTRLQHLIFALSRYQQYIHPRGPWCYASDLRQIRHELDDVQALYPLPPSHHTLPNPNSEIETETEIDISIQGVIGDTLLSSASWISGSRDTSKGDYDFYDTCIVLVSVKGATIAIPSARVLCGTPPPHTDEEVEIQNRHPPRGGTNTGSGIAWWYWVPCDDGRWLFFGSEDMTVRGKRRAVVLSDREVSMRLSRGDLFASLRDVSEVKGIVENSTLACNFLLGFLKPN